MRAKINWIMPLVAAALVACVGWWADRRISEALRDELADHLQATRNADVTALEIWMANQKRIAAVFAEEPRMRTLAVELFSRWEARDSNRLGLALSARQLIVGDRLQQRLVDLGYTVAQLVNTNFEIVLDSSRGRGRPGDQVADELQPRYADLFASGEPIVITPFKVAVPVPARRRRRSGPPDESATPPPGEVTVMQVAAPIKDTNGVTRGALAFTVNPEAEFTRILSVARSGESGETFAFDSTGLIISRSRFDGELKKLGLLENTTNASSALALHLTDPGGDLTRGYKLDTNAVLPLIEMVARATNGSAGGDVEPFRDYRGVPVIGAWKWLPDYGFGVGTKMDAQEAFHTLRVVRRVFIVLFLLLVMASLLILLNSYRQLVWRRRLTEAELKARQLGQYRLVDKIGEGGMGTVYKAQHALLRRETALKLLTPEKADPLAIQRFEREVRFTSRLAHPNTIQIYDYGRTPEGIFYYAMEYLDGLTLGDLVERYGPQSEGRVINLLIQICESLSEAHSLGLVHRDIKPANIFTCDRGGVPDMVKVLDFGLVRTIYGTGETALEKSERGNIVGTPNYLPPEAVDDASRCDARSDLYSLGAVAYYLLSGTNLFEGESVAEVCRKRLNEEPEPLAARTGRPVCPQLEAAVFRCLARDPAHRPQSAHELIALLAASPRAADWTVEKRAAWWVAHRESMVKAETLEPHPPSSATAVDIEITDRTP
jgi:tRNA A-37 threonylcarbamoyl transferase component Bud32